MENGCHTKIGMNTRETHKDKEWIIYKRTSKGTQLTCIDTIQEYQPTKHSILVRIHTTARGTVYRELGAELKIDDELPVGLAESFEQLIAEQPAWIRDLVKFVQFAPDKQTYNQMDTTIEDVLKANDKDGYLIVVSDGSVKHMHQMNFEWVLSTAGGVHLATSYGGCDGRGSLL